MTKEKLIKKYQTSFILNFNAANGILLNRILSAYQELLSRR